MFDCTITVLGDGRGKYGRSKNDRTGPVSMFMVDNVTLYSRVKTHIKSCQSCDPTAALEYYIKRRRDIPKFGGSITTTLAKTALSYERLFKKDRPVPASLVNEYLWRSGDIDLLEKNSDRMTLREMVLGAEVYVERMGKYRGSQDLGLSTKFRKVLKLVIDHEVPETDQDLEDLISIIEVMLA